MDDETEQEIVDDDTLHQSDDNEINKEEEEEEEVMLNNELEDEFEYFEEEEFEDFEPEKTTEELLQEADTLDNRDRYMQELIVHAQNTAALGNKKNKKSVSKQHSPCY